MNNQVTDGSSSSDLLSLPRLSHIRLYERQQHVLCRHLDILDKRSFVRRASLCHAILEAFNYGLKGEARSHTLSASARSHGGYSTGWKRSTVIALQFWLISLRNKHYRTTRLSHSFGVLTVEIQFALY